MAWTLLPYVYFLFTHLLSGCTHLSHLSYYRVIVGKDNVPPSGLTYWSSPTQFNFDHYYVLYINDVVASGNNTVSFTFTQTPTQATYNNVMYSIVAPEPGTSVLLYSMVVSVFYLLPFCGLCNWLTFRTRRCLVAVSL